MLSCKLGVEVWHAKGSPAGQKAEGPPSVLHLGRAPCRPHLRGTAARTAHTEHSKTGQGELRFTRSPQLI